MSTIPLVETTFHLGSISLFLVGSPGNIAACNWGKSLCCNLQLWVRMASLLASELAVHDE